MELISEVSENPQWSQTLTRLKSALLKTLDFELPYSRAQSNIGKPAAVLILFGLSQKGELQLLLTRRTETLASHKGQIAFPGGRVDPEDESRGGLKWTALRETEEEVGLPPSKVEILGRLPSLNTLVSCSVIAPFIGVLIEPIEKIELKINLDECAEAQWFPFDSLLAEGVYRQETLIGPFVKTEVYQLPGWRVWGATGAVLKNLIDRMRKVEWVKNNSVGFLPLLS